MTKENFVVKFIGSLVGITIIGGLFVVVIALKSLNKFAKMYREAQ